MASASPGILTNGPIRKGCHPVVLTCLQWDGDGALQDEDRESMLESLASGDALGTALSRSFWLHDF